MLSVDEYRDLALSAVLARGMRATLDSGGSVDKMPVLETPVTER